MDRAMTLPVEQEEGKVTRISPMMLVRRSGLLAVAGGAYMVVVPFVHPEGPQSAAWVPVHLAYFAALAVILLGLVGIFASQIQRAGWLDVAGFLTAFFGTTMMLLEGREHLFSHDFGQGTLAIDRHRFPLQHRLHPAWRRHLPRRRVRVLAQLPCAHGGRVSGKIHRVTTET